jgi:RNA recognition motif-containing protein
MASSLRIKTLERRGCFSIWTVANDVTVPSIKRVFMSKIYVGNLPFTADENAVRQLFAQHGMVESVTLINDRDSGRPRGFGFVEMPRADASRAIQNLNGQDMGGRALKVNEAQDKARGGGQQRRW